MGTDQAAELPEDWTTATLAQAADVSVVYVRRLCKNGTIRARRFGWAWLIPYAEGQRWLDERAAQSEAETLTTEV